MCHKCERSWLPTNSKYAGYHPVEGWGFPYILKQNFPKKALRQLGQKPWGKYADKPRWCDNFNYKDWS